MKSFFSLLLSLSLALAAFSQETPLQKARNYMAAGDFKNAILILKSALKEESNNLELQKYLVLAYTYDRDFAKGLEVVKPMLERSDLDVQAYQAAGNVYRALGMYKDVEKMYRKALKQFPESGPLYNDFGEALWEDKNYEAIKQWEKGIEMDPSYPGNYYNAASHYYFTKDKIWTLIYGETFVNMEYLTERATEMKRILHSTYKEKLFNDDVEVKNGKDKKNNEFVRAVQQTYDKQASIAGERGINIESLMMIRTRFLLDWQKDYAAKYPFRLFEYQQQLVKDGLFEAYNQWLFGPVENLASFDQWSKSHADTYARFTNFQRGRIYKVPKGQYYMKP